MMIANRVSPTIALPAQQGGAVLVVSLMLLLILTIAALSSTQNVLLQEKMTSAVQESYIALRSAEAGMAEGESKISLTVDAAYILLGFASQGERNLTVAGNTSYDALLNTNKSTWAAGNFSGADVNNVIPGGSSDFYIEYSGKGTLNGASSANSVVSMYNYGQAGTAAAYETTKLHFFTVVSRGNGKNANSLRVVRSSYGKFL